jgi:phosphatidylserine decarboxylase
VKPPWPHPLLAREGWPFAAVVLAAALVVTWFLGWWSAPLWLAAVFVLQFFRDPPRAVPEDARAVVSPADGRIVFVGRTRDPFLDRDALKVSVFMNVFNVHSNRAPVDGAVKKRWYHSGTFLNAALDKASA